MPRVEDNRIVESTTEARAAVTGHNVRYVLVVSTLAVIVLFVVVYLLTRGWEAAILCRWRAGLVRRFFMPVTESAREIALAFGVPPMLLAIPGDNTYANYQEANRAFWRQSVLPLAARIACALTNWLAPAFGDGLVLAADTDRVEALASDRAALWERVSNATFLTVNEKRLATGYGAVDGGDVFAR
jgi:hypothetical protein